MRTDQTGRIAAAPISWGVCEVPDWGVQLTPDRVLDEIRALGLAATEAGPEGFLPAPPSAAATLLDEYGLQLVGGFVPAPLHRSGGLEPVKVAAELMQAADADVLVVAAVADAEGYDRRGQLTDGEWEVLLESLGRAAELCAEHGLRCALHPHVGTLIEGRGDVDRVLTSSPVKLCLDTGHLLVGGVDPVELAGEYGDRISHVHLKDVDGDLAEQVVAGRRAYSDAVAHGLYRPLGDGSLELDRMITLLHERDYDGWFVLEQDVMLHDEPPANGGPADDVKRSMKCLTGLLEAVRSQ